ncbi:MAG: carboxypeptidase regulatory-like domain-containing protein [Chromatiaceae bacterium]|nr:carboxypeptidase regulatory-like domain-containing protein [Chromatiaceae bacterium]
MTEMRTGHWLAGLTGLGIALMTMPLCAEVVSGRILTGTPEQPLAGVGIEVQASGTTRRLDQASSADGAFRFDLDTLFTPQALDTEILNVIFSKPGFRSYVFSRRTRQRGVFSIGALQIRMEAINAEPAPGPGTGDADGEQLRRIFHGDYALFGEDDSPERLLEQLNERLPRHLRRGIVTHLQRLHLPADVTIDALPGELQSADSVAMRRFAREQNALAVIQGEAELVGADGDGVIEMASEFSVIPDLPEFHPGTLHIDDVIPADEIRPTRLSKQLSETWGGSTVFAMALDETRRAIHETDPAKRRERLQRAEQFLKAQQRDLPADDILKQQIEDLVAFITRARQP